ncbi:MAG: tRNA-specific adenosine deaminase [Planctomycetaceae bacterium]|nr:tRNA-specific adenosine deaminase [Planctomycetaceae bacterium]
MTDESVFMRRAIEIARHNALEAKAGGPFGCVIVRDGRIVAEGANQVLAEGDPTAHAEMVAIRSAARTLGTHVLEDCVVYTTGEPCPMCYAACWWARVKAIRFASNHGDAFEYGGFDDGHINDALALPGDARPLPSTELGRADMLEVWRAYQAMPDRIRY